MLGGSRNPAGGLGVRFGTEVYGMWVLSPGETPDARKVGVSPGRDWKTIIPRMRGINVIIIGLLLYMICLSANSQEVLSMYMNVILN